MTAARKWDEYDAYLFDVDGTLLHCRDAVHYFAFCDALTAIVGSLMNLDGVVAHGNVDTGILRDALMRTDVPEDVWRPKLEDAKNAMCAQVEKNRADLCANASRRGLAAAPAQQGREAWRCNRKPGSHRTTQAGTLWFAEPL